MSAVRCDQRGGVATLTLNRPERCNALTGELLDALNAALDRLDDPCAVVLRAEGRHFSTGGDVARFAEAVEAGRAAPMPGASSAGSTARSCVWRRCPAR
jgi:2-(1,2-epoxy-1,2-dihydrophenyl)acetyl-CoA isomerase